MQVRIYQPARTAMQQGRSRTDRWVLEHEPQSPRTLEPLMGWTSSRDTKQQVRLWFDSKEDAIAYAKREGLMYTVETAHARKVQPKAYADNFGYTRVGRWTH